MISLVLITAFAAELGDQVAKRIAKAADTTCTFDPAEKTVDCTDALVDLTDLYTKAATASRRERRALMKEWVELAVDVIQEEDADTPEALLAAFRPRIKTRGDLQATSHYAELKGSLFRPMFRELSDDLVIDVVVDSPASMRVLTTEDLQVGDVRYDDAIHKALDNLAAIPFTYTTAERGLYTVMIGDGYDSARILLTKPLKDLTLPGDPVAVLPTVDRVWLTGRDQLASLLDQALADAASPRDKPLSLVPLVFADGAWTVLTLPDTDPLANKLAELHTLQRARTSSDQAELLAEVYGKRGTPVTFAPLQHEGARSWVELTSGPALVPPVDEVRFLAGDTVTVSTWADFIERADVVREPELMPPRYRWTP